MQTYKGSINPISSKKGKIQKTVEFLTKSNQASQVIDDLIKNAKRNGESHLKQSRHFDADGRAEIEDAVELLCEQVDTLKQALGYKELELQEIEQELRYTNDKLSAALSSEWLSLEQAKELAKNILTAKKSAKEALAELLSLIYRSVVKADELEQIDIASLIAPVISDQDAYLITQSQVLRAQLSELRDQAGEVSVQARMLRNQAAQLKTRSKVLKTQFNLTWNSGC